MQVEQARFTEEFAKLEKQFNDVRCEHTKAVVALRQAERKVEREKEKSAEQLSFQQKEYAMKLERTLSQSRELEKERNMLMATIRQEGFKVPRLPAKEFSGDLIVHSFCKLLCSLQQTISQNHGNYGVTSLPVQAVSVTNSLSQCSL